MVPLKSAGFGVGWLVVLAALGWAVLPKAGSDTSLETLRAHAYLIGHLFGWLPKPREPRVHMRSPRPSNLSIPEVHGFVDADTFKAKYLHQGPMVFRNAATKQNGFDLECITGTGRPIKQQMSQLMGDSKIRIFKDSYDDGSAEFMTVDEYEALARIAEANSSMPKPYPRAFGQKVLEKNRCTPVPVEKLLHYHSSLSTTFMLDSKALLFYSSNRGTTTKMHMDVSDSLFTQVYGRKRWLFVDPEYATDLQIYGNALNMVFISGYDVHREAVPPEVPVKEVTVHPGDIVYFPPMTFHAVENLDDVTLGIDQPNFDAVGALKRHWLCGLCTILDPYMIYKAVKQFVQTGWIDGHELYFDKDSFSKNVKPS
jgi:hypothetical protein